MVLQKVGETTTEIQVNGNNEYGPESQSTDSTYNVNVSDGATTNHREIAGFVEIRDDGGTQKLGEIDTRTVNGVTVNETQPDRVRFIVDTDSQAEVTVYYHDENDNYVNWRENGTSFDSGWIDIPDNYNYENCEVKDKSGGNNRSFWILMMEWDGYSTGFTIEGIDKV
jgi:hypothetical protein